MILGAGQARFYSQIQVNLTAYEAKKQFSNFSCSIDSVFFRKIVILYLNLFEAKKFALKVINMNGPAPKLRSRLRNEFWRRKFYRQPAISRNCKKIKTEHYKNYKGWLFEASIWFFALFVPAEGKYCRVYVQFPTS